MESSKRKPKHEAKGAQVMTADWIAALPSLLVPVVKPSCGLTGALMASKAGKGGMDLKGSDDAGS